MPSIVLADNKVIDGNEFDIYKRSKEDIMSKWNTWGVIDTNVSKYVTTPNYSNPYRAGVLTQNYLNEINDNLNYYRYLVGVPLTTKTPGNNEALQTAEVIQKLNVDAGNGLTHHLDEDFAKPNDMSDAFYNLGATAENNIVSYVYNRQMHPNFDFFDESHFDTSSGHRTALLSPELSWMDYGIGDYVVYGHENKDKSQYDKMTNAYAAYPSPGYFPKQDFADTSDWDIYLNLNEFAFMTTEEEANVVVGIANRGDGTVEYRTVAENNLYFDKSSYNHYYRLIISQPTKLTTYYEDEMIVHVTNLKTKSGELVDIEYVVKFFDKLEGVPGNVDDFQFDLNLSTIHYDGLYDEKFINKALYGTGLQVHLDTGAVIYDRITKYTIKNVDTNKYNAFVNMTLPDYAKDPNDLIKNYAYISAINYPEGTYRYAYDSMEYTGKVGTTGKLAIKSFTPNTYPDSNGQDGQFIFYWFKETENALQLIDTNNKYNNETTGRLFINNLNKSDEGTYYAGIIALIPYTYYGETFYVTDFYFSKPITLKVDGIKGDMNQNGKIDLQDIIILLKKYLGTLTTTDEDKTIGDMDNNGSIGLKDIILLLRTYLGTN